MSAREIIAQIKQLPAKEQKQVIAFVHSLEYDDWDREIVTDDAAGKLNFLKEQARRAVRDNALKPLP